MLISGSMNTEKIRRKKYLNRIEMKEQREIPLLFMGKNEGRSYFGTVFEYKKNVHALLVEGEYVDRVS